MTMVPRDKTAEDQISAAKKMPSGRDIDNAGNPIDSLAVADAMSAPSGGKKQSK